MNISEMIDYSKVIKKIDPEKPLIVGGPIANGDPVFFLEHSRFDIAVYGEGELTAVELVKVIQEKGDLSGVKGIAYRDGKEIKINPPRERPWIS